MLTAEDRERIRQARSAAKFAELAAKSRGTNRRSAVHVAAAWLEEFLLSGPRASSDVKEAATRAGLSLKTLRLARQSLDVGIENGGCTGSTWSLPEEPR